MNNQMFFYPPYPYIEKDDSNYLNYEDERGSTRFFSPEETMRYGNVFKNEYDQYKSYNPRKIKAENMKEEAKLNLIALIDYCHDLRLYLDVFPNDKEVANEFNKYCKKLKEAEDKYEKMEMNPFQYVCGEGKMNYVYTPSPWIR